jgi:predicted naringenin-chalcone synthase
MQKAYQLDADQSRKLAFLYRQSEIESRYSVIQDFSLPESDWSFISVEENPSLDKRMQIFDENAAALSVAAIEECIAGHLNPAEITHLITVSCTGMSAPGLDLQVAENMQLRPDLFRTSVNFMGCYAAIHALKLGKMICDTEDSAKVIIVCTELCTIHFPQHYTPDNASSSLLFGDGSAAVLMSNALSSANALNLRSFYSEVCLKGKADMSWNVSSEGFLMKLSAYIPQLIQQDIAALVKKAMNYAGVGQESITNWCLHPGGKKILEVIQSQLGLADDDLLSSRKVLAKYGNMSSPTILFVLKEIMKSLEDPEAKVFGVAFGPGLTMETFIAEKG